MAYKVKMAQEKITQEIFDAIMQEMVGSYEVPQESLQKLSVPGMPQPGLGSSKTQKHGGSQSSSRPRSSGSDVKKPNSSSGHRRSRSPHRSESRYSKDWDRHYSRSRSPDSRSEDYRHTGRRDRSPRRSDSRSRAGGAPPQKTQRGNVMPQGQARDKPGPAGGRQDRGVVIYDKSRPAIDGLAPNVDQQFTREELEEIKMKTIMAETDALSKLGVHVIRWAGFHTITGNEFMKKSLTPSQLKTEACAKILTSFKCTLKPEHRSHCFQYVRDLGHPALCAPRLDDDFVNLLKEKRVVGSKEEFHEIIDPLDTNLLTLQTSLLKCAHPMFLACYEYELNLKPGSDTRAQLFTALEKTISLCRKSLVLLGISYSLTSCFRQDKILEAVNLKEAGPKPSNFPNLEDSFIFGKEYMTKLRKWLRKSRHPVQITYDLLTPEQKQQQVLHAKLKKVKGGKAADPMAIQMIDYLLQYNVTNVGLKGADEMKPQFWFLFDETSVEYKYYRLKLTEMQKLKRATKDAKVEANAYLRSPEDLANESVRAMILARKTAAVKKKLFRDLAFKKKRKVLRLTRGTQTDIETPLVQELTAGFEHSPPNHMPAVTEVLLTHSVSLQQTGPCTSSSSPVVPIVPQILEGGENPKPLASETQEESTSTIYLQLSEVDASTKETAENLARFLVEMGPELVGFNLDVITRNPEFWFLNKKESPAYKYYYMKFTEFRQAKGLFYDPHASKKLIEAGPEDSKSKPATSHDPSSAAGQPIVIDLSDSDCEIIEPEEPEPSVFGPLVSYCSESESSDTEDPLPPHPKHKVCELQPPLQDKGGLQSPCHQDPKIQTSLPQDSKSQNQDPRDKKLKPLLPQDQMTPPVRPQDQKPKLLLPQCQNPQLACTKDQIPQPRDPKPQPHLAQCHTPLSQDRKPQSPLLQDLKPQITLPQDQKPQNTFSHYLASHVSLPRDQKLRIPLSQDLQPQCHPQNLKCQTLLPQKPTPTLPQDKSPQTFLPTNQNPQTFLTKPKAQTPLLLLTDEKPETSLPQSQKPQLALTQDRKPQTPLPQNQKTQMTLLQDWKPHPPPKGRIAQDCGTEYTVQYRNPSLSKHYDSAERRSPEEVLQSASSTESPLQRKRGMPLEVVNVLPKRLYSTKDATGAFSIKTVSEKPSGRQDLGKKQSKQTVPINTELSEKEERDSKEVEFEERATISGKGNFVVTEKQSHFPVKK